MSAPAEHPDLSGQAPMNHPCGDPIISLTTAERHQGECVRCLAAIAGGWATSEFEDEIQTKRISLITTPRKESH